MPSKGLAASATGLALISDLDPEKISLNQNNDIIERQFLQMDLDVLKNTEFACLVFTVDTTSRVKESFKLIRPLNLEHEPVLQQMQMST